MEIYKKKQENKKRWSIKLVEDLDGNIILHAVDSETGHIICNLINFYYYGEIYIASNAKSSLMENGYDPYEHNNKFSANGSILISM